MPLEPIMSDESKEKRHHEQHHPHHHDPHKHEHSQPVERTGIHPGWFLGIGGVLLILVVLAWILSSVY